MFKYFLFIIVISLLWHMSLSSHECDRTINGSQITFKCTLATNQFELFDLSVAQLNSITSIVVRNGDVDSSTGPLTSIPPNICLLRNLQIVDFSYNQIVDVDPTGALTDCFSKVITFDVSHNSINTFPSFLIYHMPNLQNLYFQQNQLSDVPFNAFVNVSFLDTIDFSYNRLTTFELWALEVKTKADFSHNRIARITNTYFFTEFRNTEDKMTADLTDNYPTIDFTDAIYAMYDQCEEVDQWYVYSSGSTIPYFTRKVSNINFGTTQIDCSCDQIYFLRILTDSYGFVDGIPSTVPIRTATCINNTDNFNNAAFINSSCISSLTSDINSTVDFTTVYPRLCKIFYDEEGDLTEIPAIPEPESTTPAYPHYETVFTNPGACVFSFSDETSASVICTNETSNTLSKIPENLLSNTYMSKITRVTFPSPISSLPSYLCSLPSGEIDLSQQAFTVLNDITFPCLDSFTKVTLSNNQLTSVNMASGDFKNLTSLDLSSNKLTQIPYSILRPTPTSLRLLDLRNNSIGYIDLFVYTLKDITINLDGNPIDSSNITNSQNATLNSNTTSTVNITFPSTVTNSSIVIEDSTAGSLYLCTTFNSIRSFLINFRSIGNVTLRCTCASFGLKTLYQVNGFNISQDFNCSNAADAENFAGLNNMTCSDATYFQPDICPYTTTISTDMTTMEIFNISIEFTSTSLTTALSNISLSSTFTLNTSNETQSTISTENSTTSTVTTLSSNTTSSEVTIPSGNDTTNEITTPGTAAPGGNVTTNGTTTTMSNMSLSSSSPTTAPPIQSSRSSDSDRTGLIVGLVVGLVGGAALIGGAIAAFLYIHSKSAARGAKKTVSRVKVLGQSPGDSLSTRVQPRNLRAVRLAPISAESTTALPDIPVKAIAPKTNGTLLRYSNSTLKTSAKGIPVRFDSVRSPGEINPTYPPNSNALNNSSSFRPINNISTHQANLPQQLLQAPKPRTNPILNTGGDLR